MLQKTFIILLRILSKQREKEKTNRKHTARKKNEQEKTEKETKEESQEQEKGEIQIRRGETTRKKEQHSIAVAL
jgi:hypothetical protein